MTLVHAATDTDRLPWLTDDLPPKSRGGIGGWLGWALAGTMAVGGLSFWLGMNADRFSGATDPVEITQPDATVAAPQQELIVPAPEAPHSVNKWGQR